MNKGFLNLMMLVAALLIMIISFSGCSTLEASPKTSEKTEVNKNQGLSRNETTGDEAAKSDSSNNSVNQKREILWDFRKNTADEPQKFSEAETRAVVKYLFGGNANHDLEITSRVSGSFTKPNATETLYFLSGCEDDNDQNHLKADCQSNSFHSAGWIAVYNQTTPVTKIKADLGNGGIVKITDFNGDGINEILSFSNYSAYELQNTSASIGQISDNKYQDIKSFDGYALRCFEDSSKGFDAASSISYLPTSNGKMPTFSVEYFQSGCKDASSWKKITKKQFDAFFNL